MRQTLTLEICSNADSLAGVLRDSDGVPHRFSGWCGFAAALETAIRLRGDGLPDHPARQRP